MWKKCGYLSHMLLLVKYFYFFHLKWKIKDKCFNNLFEKRAEEMMKVKKGSDKNSSHLATIPMTDTMLYSIFIISFNPHCNPLSTLRLRNIKPCPPYFRRGNWSFKRWSDTPCFLNLGWGKGRIWTPLFQLSLVCSSSSPSHCLSLSFGPLSCMAVLLLDLQGCGMFIQLEQITLFSL